ncbi:hypothetical protein K438DRAFT_1858995 [Mycena galopus ATCC 62051]|nr:hypothetical protein K438DRAFT_1858995 [Mycena galopus ATCC 62051]
MLWQFRHPRYSSGHGDLIERVDFVPYLILYSLICYTLTCLDLFEPPSIFLLMVLDSLRASSLAATFSITKAV